MSNKNNAKKSALAVVQEAIQFTGSNLGLFLIVALCCTISIIMTAPEQPGEEFNRYALSFNEWILLLVIGAMIELLPLASAYYNKQGESFSLLRSLKLSFCRVIPYIIVMAIVSLVIFVGLLALVIPGIFAAIYFSAVPGVIFAERQGIFGSMGRSMDLVSGNKMLTFKLMLWTFLVFTVLHGIAALVMIIFGVSPDVANVAAEPLVYVILTVIYAYSAVFGGAVFMFHYQNLKS